MPASVPMEDEIPTEMMGEPLSKADAKAIADKLKEDIKAWEVEFRQREGREPNNEDKEAIRSKCDAFGRYKLAYERAEDPTGWRCHQRSSMPPWRPSVRSGAQMSPSSYRQQCRKRLLLAELTTGGGGDDDKTEQSTHGATTGSTPVGILRRSSLIEDVGHYWAISPHWAHDWASTSDGTLATPMKAKTGQRP